MTISERVAYIKGLADGMDLQANTKENKILLAIIDVLEDMAYEIEDLNENQLDIGDELDALSEDLSDVEQFVFGLDEEDICFDDEDEDECCCGEDDECCCDDDCCCDEEEDCCCDCEDDEEEYVMDEDLEFEVTCPECEADIALSEADLLKGEIVCPSCGEKLEFEFDGFEDEE